MSAGDAFAPGEALYRSGLVGMRVSEAAPRLKQLGLTAEWRDERADTSAPVPASSPAPVPSPTATVAAPGSLPTSSAASASASPQAKVTSGVSVTVTAEDIPDNWVTGAVPIAEGKVLVFTSKDKPSSNP